MNLTPECKRVNFQWEVQLEAREKIVSPLAENVVEGLHGEADLLLSNNSLRR